MKHIDKLGVELEGAWITRRSDMKGDGSVHIVGNSHYITKVGHFVTPSQNPKHDSLREGELNSPPGKLLPILDYIKTNYPDAVNISCGLHIHFSFKSPNAYVLLASMEFYKYFIAELNRWGLEKKIPSTHTFWNRLKGRNEFCNGDPEENISCLKEDHGDRYYALNFASYHKHKTMECRILPMFETASLSLEAVTAVVSIVEKYLQEQFNVFLSQKEFTCTIDSDVEEYSLEVDMPEAICV